MGSSQFTVKSSACKALRKRIADIEEAGEEFTTENTEGTEKRGEE
jgi:hypothetical protein